MDKYKKIKKAARRAFREMQAIAPDALKSIELFDTLDIEPDGVRKAFEGFEINGAGFIRTHSPWQTAKEVAQAVREECLGIIMSKDDKAEGVKESDYERLKRVAEQTFRDMKYIGGDVLESLRFEVENEGEGKKIVSIMVNGMDAVPLKGKQFELNPNRHSGAQPFFIGDEAAMRKAVVLQCWKAIKRGQDDKVRQPFERGLPRISAEPAITQNHIEKVRDWLKKEQGDKGQVSPTAEDWAELALEVLKRIDPETLEGARVRIVGGILAYIESSDRERTFAIAPTSSGNLAAAALIESYLRRHIAEKSKRLAKKLLAEWAETL